MFQLKHRLGRLRVSQTNNSIVVAPDLSSSRSRLVDDGNSLPNDLQPMASASDDLENSPNDGMERVGADEFEDVLIDTNGIRSDPSTTTNCSDKTETGNQKVRARFGRRRTHNEQICICSCGVILGRATFFGSEAPNGVRVCLNFLSFYTRSSSFSSALLERVVSNETLPPCGTLA